MFDVDPSQLQRLKQSDWLDVVTSPNNVDSTIDG